MSVISQRSRGNRPEAIWVLYIRNKASQPAPLTAKMRAALSGLLRFRTGHPVDEVKPCHAYDYDRCDVAVQHFE